MNHTSSFSRSNNTSLVPLSSIQSIDIAELSIIFRSLMERHSIKCDFTMLGNGGPCLIDATQNPTNAYKLRGALACTAVAKRKGASSVWTASAGNHGAGVALAAKFLEIAATVYVPTSAPRVKIDKIKGFGAKVVEAGETFDDCLAYARSVEPLSLSASTFIHPFNETLVAAGQGTIGLEIFEHVRSSTALQRASAVTVYVPIGGGGLIAGVASTLRGLWPDNFPQLRIVGVVDEGVPASALGTLFGRPIASIPTTIADGTRVARVGDVFLDITPLIDNIMLVPHDAIVATMRHYFSEYGQVMEGAGALALTGEFIARKYGLLDSEKSLNYAILSGRNVDEQTFSEIVNGSEKQLSPTKRRVAFDVKIPEQDGQLLKFLRVVQKFNISSLTYKRQEEAAIGTLRAEFELPVDNVKPLQNVIQSVFAGSDNLAVGAQMVLPVSAPVAHSYRDRLVTLEDYPGSFLKYVEGLEQSNQLRSIGFLYYRKPSVKNLESQVVIGLEG